MTIASAALHAIVAEAGRSASEICGLLFGEPGRVDGWRSCLNVAADPTAAFEIDPRALLAAHRAMRGGGPRLVGCYHSHPSGGRTPSARDAAAAAPDGWLWLIAADGEAELWRAVARGRRHGRFDPVPFRRV